MKLGTTTQLGVLVFIILMIIITSKNQNEEFYEGTTPNNPQLIALDSIAESLEEQGWTSDAANIIAGFEVDLYDMSDTAEYRLYRAYMED